MSDLMPENPEKFDFYADCDNFFCPKFTILGTYNTRKLREQKNSKVRFSVRFDALFWLTLVTKW